MSINRVNISGNLTRSPELRATQGGTSILTFSVAVNDRRRNPQTGEWDDYPGYFDCVVFGSRAEPLSRFLDKGTKVAIDGKLRWSQWEDKNGGGKRSKVEIIVDEVEFLSSRQGQSAPQSAPQPGYAPQSRSGYANPQQPPMAPPMAPQAPAAPMPQYGGYQPTQPSDDLYPEPIPF